MFYPKIVMYFTKNINFVKNLYILISFFLSNNNCKYSFSEDTEVIFLDVPCVCCVTILVHVTTLIHILLHSVYFRRSQLAMTFAVYWLCVAVLLSCNVLVQSEITTLYPTDPQDWSLFPYGAGDVELQDGDDATWQVEGLTHDFNFFGTTYNQLQVKMCVSLNSFKYF